MSHNVKWRSLSFGFTLLLGLLSLLFAGIHTTAQDSNRNQYPFQNPDLSTEQRIDNLLSLMNIEEKISCLGTNPSVPRLGIKASGHVEGIHGLTQGGPGKWGRRSPVTATQFHEG